MFYQALLQLKALKAENEATNGGGPFIGALGRTSDLKSLSITALKSMQSQLRSDLEEIEKVKQTLHSDLNNYWCKEQFSNYFDKT